MAKNNICIKLPENVEKIIKALEHSGYKAYAVGGCIRDSLMGIQPFDWDITTNATPLQVKAVFQNEKIFETGIKHGTVTLVMGGINYEITTFRTEGKYSDNRHPDSIEYADNIYNDLSRRDFTVNAMAYSPTDGLVTCEGAYEDLKNKVLRTVGNADERFLEDALRILRALRFSSVLRFLIDPDTKKAIFKNKNLLKNISCERIKAEVFKMITGKNFKYVCLTYKDVLNGLFKDTDLSLLPDSFFDKNTEYKSDVVFSAMVNRASLNPVENAVSLKLSNTEKHVLKIGATSYINNPVAFDVLKLVCDMGEQDFLSLLDIWDLMGNNTQNYRHIFNEAKDKNLCLSIKQMAVSGDEFAKHFKNSEISKAINNTLYAIIRGDICNTKEDIIKYIEQ